MLVLSKKGFPPLLIWIGLLLTMIGPIGAIKCYVCSGDACKADVVPSEECESYEFCVYGQYPEERRECNYFFGGDPRGCHYHMGGRGWECSCDKDLCNTPAIWAPPPNSIKCYVCSGDECKKDVIHSADCGDQEVCVYSQNPEERRYCELFPEDTSLGCNGKACFCDEDLCNARAIWNPNPPCRCTYSDCSDTSPSALSAAPLLIILGSLIPARAVTIFLL